LLLRILEPRKFLRAIESEGFATIDHLLNPGEISGLLKDFSDPRLPCSRAGVRHALSHPAIAALARDARLISLAEQILGRDAFPFRATLFEKSPQANWLVVWHQDTALPLRERKDLPGWGPWSMKEGVVYAHAPATALSQVLALRVHLDDSNADNGPLRVLPGTHTMGVLSDDAIHQLTTQIPAVDCLLPPGGVLAMKPLLVHASSKSQTEMPRRVLHIEYAPSTMVSNELELTVT
jgi:ectoine hydroxylase-related dioxygenase (phytanoyl-CoA dioxygenase family)